MQHAPNRQVVVFLWVRFLSGDTSKCTTEVTASKTRKAGAKASSASSGKSLRRDHEAFITSRLEVGLSAERIHRELRDDFQRIFSSPPVVGLLLLFAPV